MRRARVKDPLLDARNKDTYQKKDPARARYKNLKSRCKGTLQLSLEEYRRLFKTDTCPICGVTYLDKDPSRKRLRSVDRLDPTGPYSEQNCWAICHRCNQVKSNWSVEQFRRLIKLVEDEMKQRGLV